eukprot:Nitzschia sp. Nitz4//scaffold53_size117307//19099//20674//NITZ4_003757-RA/size117307-augustus-gene-0.91-mRNA-1//1//CDS//3329554166//7960//frame0
MEATAPFELLSCTPQELAQYLNVSRFAGDADKAREFLQTAAQAVSEKAQSNAIITPNKESKSDFGSPMLAEPFETSLLTPRGGKVSIQLYDAGYMVATSIKNPCNELILPASALTHIICFAKPEDYKLIASGKNKPPNAHLLLLKLKSSGDGESDAVTFQNKKVTQVCFALSWAKGTGPTGPSLSSSEEAVTVDGWKQATKAWCDLFQNCFVANNADVVVSQVQPLDSDESWPFASDQTPGQSTTTGGMPFVKCYHGVHDGVLFPLHDGLLFYKPPQFLARQNLRSIACGRGSGGGQSSSRYVDMVLQTDGTDSSETVEFTNIQREELGVLNEYVQDVLIPAMQEDVKEDNKADGTVDDAVVDVEESEDDNVVEVESDSEDENFDENHDDDETDEEEEDDSDEEESDVEVVDDDFAAELKKGPKPKDLSGPRASRSRSRGQKRVAQEDSASEEVVLDVVEEDSDDMVNDDDFAVVQAHSETESEEEEGAPSDSKKRRM